MDSVLGLHRLSPHGRDMMSFSNSRRCRCIRPRNVQMSRRLNTVLEHIRPTQKDTLEHEHLKHHLIVQSLKAQMVLGEERLKEMALYMLHEMHRGLEPGNKSTLRMLPSFVYKRDTSKLNSVVYALDLGGSNFRVLRLQLANGAIANLQSKKFAIPAQIIAGGTAEQLFDFLAASIEDSLNSFGRSDELKKPLKLGFTFSFPVDQLAIASGNLIKWTKQFTTSGVEGNDVVALLRKALDRKKIALQVAALCNDTVGTLITRFTTDQTTQLGVILGTGSNACYWELNRNITKCKDAQSKSPTGEMVINMEFGNFDSHHMVVLPATHYDNELDESSENKGHQRLEKMISGKYLGEIARRVIVDFAKKGVLPGAVAEKLAKEYSFESRFAGACVADHHPGMPDIQRLFKDEFGVDLSGEHHRRVVRTVCAAVSNRAARLAGMAIAATLLKRNAQADATIAVDGSVFEKQPYFRKEMYAAIKAVLGSSEGIRLQLTVDGSGVGAGCIAALQ
jgi:hexokinase